MAKAGDHAGTTGHKNSSLARGIGSACVVGVATCNRPQSRLRTFPAALAGSKTSEHQRKVTLIGSMGDGSSKEDRQVSGGGGGFCGGAAMGLVGGTLVGFMAGGPFGAAFGACTCGWGGAATGAIRGYAQEDTSWTRTDAFDRAFSTGVEAGTKVVDMFERFTK